VRPQGSDTLNTFTIVLIPGLLCDGWIWRHQAAALAARAPVHVPVLYEPPTLTAMAQRILDETAGPLAVAGHSMGGRVAFEMARLAPKRIVRLAGLDTGHDAAKPEERPKRMALVDRARREGMAAMAGEWLPPMMHPDRVDDAPLMEALTAMVSRATPDIFARQQNALLTRPDAAPHLRNVTCPTSFVCGRQDRWSPLAQHEAMQAMVRSSTLTAIEDAGHMSPVEQPDAVTAALVRWLEQ